MARFVQLIQDNRFACLVSCTEARKKKVQQRSALIAHVVVSEPEGEGGGVADVNLQINSARLDSQNIMHEYVLNRGPAVFTTVRSLLCGLIAQVPALTSLDCSRQRNRYKSQRGSCSEPPRHCLCPRDLPSLVFHIRGCLSGWRTVGDGYISAGVAQPWQAARAGGGKPHSG
jgi:hypothetical protein